MTPRGTASLSRRVAKTCSCTSPQSRWRDSRLCRKDKRSSSRFAPEKRACTPRTWCESDVQPDSRPFDPRLRLPPSAGVDVLVAFEDVADALLTPTIPHRWLRAD